MAGSGLVVPGMWRWLRLTKETTWGSYDADGDVLWVRLTEDSDGFNPKRTAVRTTIRSADGYNRRRTNISSKYTVAASLNCPLYPSQSQYLLDAAGKLTAASGQPPDVNSYTADYFDGQCIRRYLGGKFNSMGISSSADSMYASVAAQLTFQKTDDGLSTLAQPADSLFPTDTPWLHSEAGGKLTQGASATPVPMFDTVSTSIGNKLASAHFDQQFISYLRWTGRDVDLSTHLTYLDTSWRDVYEAQTQAAYTLTYYRSSTHSLEFNYETVSFLAERSLATPLGGVSTQGISIEAFYDQTTGTATDFEYTIVHP